LRQGGLWRGPRPRHADRRTVFPQFGGIGHRRLAPRGCHRHAAGHPDPGFSSALSYYDALPPSGCPPRSPRVCVTSSAPTPTGSTTSQKYPRRRPGAGVTRWHR